MNDAGDPKFSEQLANERTKAVGPMFGAMAALCPRNIVHITVTLVYDDGSTLQAELEPPPIQVTPPPLPKN